MICWTLNVPYIFGTYPANCFSTCINTSRALKMQRIECGLFAPQCLLSVCLPFLAKVHPKPATRGLYSFQKLSLIIKNRDPEPATKELPPVFGFKSWLTGGRCWYILILHACASDSPQKMHLRAVGENQVCIIFSHYLANKIYRDVKAI